MLFDPERHEPLRAAAWDESRARAAILDICEDAERVKGHGITWPWHPLDQTGDEPEHKSIYLGAAGVLGALAYLQREGAVRLELDAAEAIERAYGAYLDEPDTGKRVPSFFLGEVGILLVHWRLTKSAQVAHRLEESIRENIPNPANEALWAAPGTMVAALHMLEWTQDSRWERLFLENVAHLWSIWKPSENAPCDLWTQDLYGEVVQLLGAGHGFAGNAYPLLRGAALLPAQQRESLFERCERTVVSTAIVEGGCANWPPHVGQARNGREKILMQWCHGAPGMVTSMTHFPAGRSPAMDKVLRQAGEAIWNAGPLLKGFGLCHGTAGNGYALLVLHRRTGDPIWLERARAFALHSIAQAEQMRGQYGRRRHCLWTGDLGLAVYLWHCIQAAGALPSLGVL